ncbi:Ltp family lipoprotein [Microbacterium sp.]|uniref:Ltp family lipoprotein n=1 Tax=Microbacterium sp. TaxID=51671 RepID=UPI003F995FFA
MPNDSSSRAPGAPLPGWYPAPHADGEQRYWDGAKWLEPATNSTNSSEQSKKSRKGLWITLSIIGGVIVLGGVGGALGLDGEDTDDDAIPAASQSDEPTQVPTHEPDDEADDAADDEPTSYKYTAEPDPRPEEPEPEPEPEPEEPGLTLGQENAIGSAHNYLDYAGFSRESLIGQLEYEGYSTEEATFAVDYIAPDWNEEAAESAQSYIDYTDFSRQGLIEQLLYEGFTQKQAEFGASAVGY